MNYDLNDVSYNTFNVVEISIIYLTRILCIFFFPCVSGNAGTIKEKVKVNENFFPSLLD